MKIIDRHNYEAWLLDRLEGRLTPEEIRALDAFLSANPDLVPDADDLPAIGAGAIPYAEKFGLKRALPPSGMPTLQEIDDFLVARLEGELTNEQMAALDGLLKKEPAAARAWSLMQRTRVVGSAATFADQEKLQLKRTLPPVGLPTMELLDDFLVARLEGQLSSEQEAALERLLKNDSAAARSWSLMQRTRVVPAAIKFPDKSRLKKEKGRVIPMVPSAAPSWQRLAIAASIALVLGLAWWVLSQRGNEVPGIADKENAIGPKEHPAPVVPTERKEPPAPIAESKDQGSGTVPAPTEQRNEEKQPEGVHQDQPQAPAIAREPVPDRVDPLLAERPDIQHVPVNVPVPVVPISNDPPSEFAQKGGAAPADDAMTMGELLAATVRSEVLDEQDAPKHALDRNDAVALLDKGLGAVSGDQAGLTYQRGEQRRRFRLKLGENLAFAASTSR